jgi:hypothetical protein
MTTKRIVVLKSFVTISSFDCDHTQIYYGTLMGENLLKCTTQNKKNLVFIVDFFILYFDLHKKKESKVVKNFKLTIFFIIIIFYSIIIIHKCAFKRLKTLEKKDRIGWQWDKILVHLKNLHLNVLKNNYFLCMQYLMR